MKRRSFVVAAFAALSAAAVSLPKSSLAHGTHWWNSLSQSQRTQYILNRAYQDNCRYVGKNCKEWVQRVVSDASGGHVWLPQTANSGTAYWWNYDSTGHTAQRYSSIYYVQRGDIVQMNWLTSSGWTPHTFIVTAVYGDRLSVIESNWGQGNYLTVNTRVVYFSDFQSKTQGKYTIYYVK